MQNNNEWLTPPVLKNTLFFQSENGFSLMVMENQRQEILDIPLVKIEFLLPPEHFFRVHRNYLVNMNAISELRYYRTQFFAFIHDYRIPVSRRKKKILMNSLDVL